MWSELFGMLTVHGKQSCETTTIIIVGRAEKVGKQDQCVFVKKNVNCF